MGEMIQLVTGADTSITRTHHFKRSNRLKLWFTDFCVVKFIQLHSKQRNGKIISIAIGNCRTKDDKYHDLLKEVVIF